MTAITANPEYAAAIIRDNGLDAQMMYHQEPAPASGSATPEIGSVSVEPAVPVLDETPTADIVGTKFYPAPGISVKWCHCGHCRPIKESSARLCCRGDAGSSGRS